MAIFGVRLKRDNVLDDFVYKFQEKLKSPDMFQNPFKGFIKSMGEGVNHYLFIYLDLVWINPVYMTLILTGALWLAWGFSFHWTHLFLIPLYLGSFMFTSTFSKIAIYISLRKHGYKGKISFLNDTSLLLRLARWDKKK
jgi:hypothetical protein